jgi:hypothetical protein
MEDKNISFPKGNPVDLFGRVFFKDGRVFRAISTEYEGLCKELMKSSLIKELTEKKLIPETVIANFKIDGFSIVLEHEKVTQTQPSEWTFEMLKDAAAAILEINNLCRKHSYCLKDAHPWNMAFKENKPIFLDFGSIMTENDNYKESFSQEFKDTVLYPLILWSKGEDLIAQALLSSPHNIYKFTIPKKTLSDSGLMGHVLDSLKNNFEVSDEYVRSLIHEKLQDTMWAKYQDEFFTEIDSDKFCERFGRLKRIEKLLEEFSPDSRTILDLAGNMGAMAFYIEKNGKFEKIINIDYDENAVEFSYKKLKSLGSRVETYLVNFMLPKQQDIYENLKSDVVLALAVTHHLVLTQNFSLDYIFDKIKLFSKKYVYIEFMPLGLWGGGDLPPIPDWYTEEWFRKKFVKKFDLIHREQFERNRIIFVGKVKS